MKRFLTTLTLVVALTVAQWSLSSPAWALYQLEFGDTISVMVKDAPQYSVPGAQIRPDGAITVPYLGDLEVSGLTPGQVGDRIQKLVSRYVRNPEVTVTVTGFRGRVIAVFGQVTRPGNLTVPAAPVNPTVLDAIGQAGGFTDRANRSEVIVIRGEGANAQRFVVDVEKMLKSSDFSGNIAIQERDKIIVPEVWYPDYRGAIGVIGTVASVLTMVSIIINVYNRASSQ